MRERTVTDPDVLKALTHPLRRRLYRLLCKAPANVRMLGERTGADPGQLSYHLRQLAKGEFIEEAPELARDGRERWWRAVGESWSTTSDLDDPAAQAIAQSLYQLGVTEEFQRLREYDADPARFGPDWAGAAYSSNSNFRLTPAELAELWGELGAVLRRWAEAGIARTDPAIRPEEWAGDGKLPVFLFVHAFPEDP